MAKRSKTLEELLGMAFPPPTGICKGEALGVPMGCGRKVAANLLSTVSPPGNHPPVGKFCPRCEEMESRNPILDEFPGEDD